MGLGNRHAQRPPLIHFVANIITDDDKMTTEKGKNYSLKMKLFCQAQLPS